MRVLFFITLYLNCFITLFAQDSSYARSIIKELTSANYYGRGYLKNGLDNSSKYIVEKIKQNHGLALFKTGYYQWFDFDVNTFPKNVSVKINNKLLKPGVDYIISPESSSLKGKYKLIQKDSLNYIAEDHNVNLSLQLKRKLTFSVASNSVNACKIELLYPNNFKELKTAEVFIESKVLTKYINKNICSYLNGTTTNDSMIVFTAHYDHLGGMGKQCFFPGANDNASGVSMLLNLMRHYDKNPPKYKTVFIFFAGEEAGLIGSHYFVESKVLDLSKIKFLINLDLLGTGDEGIMVVNGAIHEKEFSVLQQLNTEKNYLKEIKKRGKAQNSDHYWFTEARVPCFFIYTMGGIKAYHDVYDIEKTLPLTKYENISKLIKEFVKTF